MKVRSLIALAVLFAFSIPIFSASSAASAFASLKSLAGTWENKHADGKSVEISLRVISEGSAIMEEMSHDSMVTIYHMDNDRLLMTHYCAAHNQPRMQAEVSADGKTITFNFIDATNLASPEAGHMRKMVLTIQDKDHFSESWSFHKDGKEMMHETFQYTRKQ